MSVERGRTAPEVRLLKLAFQATPGIRVKPPTTELEAQRLEAVMSDVLSGLPRDERDLLAKRFKVGTPGRDLDEITTRARLKSLQSRAFFSLQKEEVVVKLTDFLEISQPKGFKNQFLRREQPINTSGMQLESVPVTVLLGPTVNEKTIDALNRFWHWKTRRGKFPKEMTIRDVLALDEEELRGVLRSYRRLGNYKAIIHGLKSSLREYLTGFQNELTEKRLQKIAQVAFGNPGFKDRLNEFGNNPADIIGVINFEVRQNPKLKEEIDRMDLS